MVSSGDQTQDVPAGLNVHSVFALDTKWHISLFGRYPAFLAKPDCFGAAGFFPVSAQAEI